MGDEPNELTREFNNLVREYILYLLYSLCLYMLSWGVIVYFRKPREQYYADEEDNVVYRVALWMCNISLATSMASALLLPTSIVSNEVLLRYPSSFYIQWLNSSLIQGLWNGIFLFSNVSILVLLPFAYLFTESEGLPGSTKGLWARFYETFLVLVLIAAVIFGIAVIVSAIFDGRNSFSLYSWYSGYLPFLYSCLSFIGTLLLMVCTPLGFARLFTVVGELLVKPGLLHHIEEEYENITIEENNLRWRLRYLQNQGAFLQHTANEVAQCKYDLARLEKRSKELLEQRSFPMWRRNLGYPLVMIGLLFLTGISVLLVLRNTLELCTGFKSLPIGTREFSLGIASLSTLGIVGSTIEILLIFYMWIASIVGLYSMPLIGSLRPRPHNTTLTQIIGNCAILLTLSSALPVLTRAIGITNFDLLGDFGRIEWLGNLAVVLAYNVGFMGAAGVCLTTKFTSSVRSALMGRFTAIGRHVSSRISAIQGRPKRLNSRIIIAKED